MSSASNSNETEPPVKKTGFVQRCILWLKAPLSKTSRVMLALGGIVAPIVCHLSTLDGPPHGGRWQSGELDDQLAFILTIEAGYVFYPLMLLAIVSLGIYLLRWPIVATRTTFWILLGMINGVLVSLWYLCIFVIVATGQPYFDPVSTLVSLLTLLILSAVPLVAWSAFTFMKYLCRKFHQPDVGGGMVLLIVYFVIGTSIQMASDGNGFLDALKGSFSLPFILGVIFAPVWSLTAYTFVSFRLLTIEKAAPQFSLRQLMGLVTYAAGLITACRTSVWLSLSAYSRLPLENPSNCYVATAASKGHRYIVGTQTTSGRENHEKFPVNRQLQVLKAFEVAIRALCPVGHRHLRMVYDFIGPRLARRIDQPWKADIAFLTLMPIAWLAEVGLLVLLGHRRDIISSLYIDSID